MLKSKTARIGFLIAAVGIAVLGYSLFSFTQNGNQILYLVRDYKWVAETGQKFSDAKARDTEWVLNANCLHNYTATKLARVKIDQEEHERAMPAEMRVWLEADRTRSIDLIPKDNPGRYMFKAFGDNSELETLNGFHMKHRGWFDKRRQFPFTISTWENELRKVSARYFRESQLRVFTTGSFDAKLKTQFQLFFFSDEEAKNIVDTCATKTPIAQVVDETNLKAELGYWPNELQYTFYGGLLLLLLGLAYHPVTNWVRAGN